MIVIKISTLALIVFAAFLIGCIFSPIVMLIDKIKSRKEGKQNEAE